MNTSLLQFLQQHGIEPEVQLDLPATVLESIKQPRHLEHASAKVSGNLTYASPAQLEELRNYVSTKREHWETMLRRKLDEAYNIHVAKAGNLEELTNILTDLEQQVQALPAQSPAPEEIVTVSQDRNRPLNFMRPGVFARQQQMTPVCIRPDDVNGAYDSFSIHGQNVPVFISKNAAHVRDAQLDFDQAVQSAVTMLTARNSHYEIFRTANGTPLRLMVLILPIPFFPDNNKFIYITTEQEEFERDSLELFKLFGIVHEDETRQRLPLHCLQRQYEIYNLRCRPESDVVFYSTMRDGLPFEYISVDNYDVPVFMTRDAARETNYESHARSIRTVVQHAVASNTLSSSQPLPTHFQLQDERFFATLFFYTTATLRLPVLLLRTAEENRTYDPFDAGTWLTRVQ